MTPIATTGSATRWPSMVILQSLVPWKTTIGMKKAAPSMFSENPATIGSNKTSCLPAILPQMMGWGGPFHFRATHCLPVRFPNTPERNMRAPFMLTISSTRCTRLRWQIFSALGGIKTSRWQTANSNLPQMQKGRWRRCGWPFSMPAGNVASLKTKAPQKLMPHQLSQKQIVSPPAARSKRNTCWRKRY